MFLVHEMKLFHQYHHNVMQGSGFRFSLIMQGIAIINTIGAILSGWSSLTSKSLWKIFSWIIPELNFSPLYSWIFFNFKMKKKKKKIRKTISNINVFGLFLKFTSDNCTFVKLKMFLSLGSFMKETLELKVDLWEFLFFAANKRGLK